MGHARKLKDATRCYKVVQNARADANCTRAHEGGGWRSGGDAGSFVGTIVVGYARSDCAISVVTAPLLVSREVARTADLLVFTRS